MYADLLEPNVLAAQVSSDDRKRFAPALINRHPDLPVDCHLNLSALPRDAAVKVRLLAGDSPDAYNDVDRPGRVVPETREWKLQGGAVQLPPHSVSIVQALV